MVEMGCGEIDDIKMACFAEAECAVRDPALLTVPPGSFFALVAELAPVGWIARAALPL
jgi:hypothetical protein